MSRIWQSGNRGGKAGGIRQEDKKSPRLERARAFYFLRLYNVCSDKIVYPQEPELQEPELHPPLPIGLVEVMEKPDLYPASMKSTFIVPQEVNNSSSTRKVTESS